MEEMNLFQNQNEIGPKGIQSPTKRHFQLIYFMLF